MNFVKKMFYGKKLEMFLESGRENVISGNYYMAIKDFTFALEIDEKNEEALLNRGMLHYKVKHYLDSLYDLQQLEKIKLDYNPLQNFFLSKVYLKLNDTKNASAYASKYYKSNPNDHKIQFFTARMKYFNGEYEEALILADRICELMPKNFNIRYLHGLINFALKKYDSALIDINKAIEISSEEDYLFNLRGLINVECEKFSEAIENFEYAIKINPEKACYHFNKAKILYQINEFEEAKRSIDKSLEIEPNNKYAILLKAELNNLSENYEGMIEDLDLYQTFEPGNTNIILKKAALKTMIYDFEGAKNDILAAIKLKNNDVNLYFHLAYTEYKLNNFSSALESLEKCIQFNSEMSDAYLQKGILEFLSQNYQKANLTLEEYLKLNPDSENAVIIKIQCLVKLGLLKEAQTEIENYKDISLSDDFKILSSKINYANGNVKTAQKEIQDAVNSGKFNKSIEIVNNALKLEAGLTNEIREINENKQAEIFKVDSQILNALISFEKDHYHTVKYKLSNINNLEKHTEEKLKPLTNYVNKQIG